MKLILFGIVLILFGYVVNTITSALGPIVFLSLVVGLTLAIVGVLGPERK